MGGSTLASGKSVEYVGLFIRTWIGIGTRSRQPSQSCDHYITHITKSVLVLTTAWPPKTDFRMVDPEYMSVIVRGFC